MAASAFRRCDSPTRAELESAALVPLGLANPARCRLRTETLWPLPMRLLALPGAVSCFGSFGSVMEPASDGCGAFCKRVTPCKTKATGRGYPWCMRWLAVIGLAGCVAGTASQGGEDRTLGDSADNDSP